MLTTKLLTEEKNPYNLENMPVATNLFGIFYPVVVYPFAKLLGPTLLVHRTVTGISIILACVILAFVMKQKNILLLYIFSALLIFYLSLLFFTTPISRPDGLGEFLFLSSVFFPALFRYSRRSLLISILFGLLGFYTKPYFVLSIAYVTTYLFLFVSKKKGIVYGVLSFIFLIIFSLIINAVFESYYINIFFISKNIAGTSVNFALKQLRIFFKLYFGLVLIAVIGVFTSFRTIKQRYSHILQKIHVFDVNKPLIAIDFPFSLFCFFLSCSVIYFKLGRHEGNYIVYLLHLMLPFLLTFAYTFTDPKKIPYFIIVPLLFFTLYRMYSFTFPPPLYTTCSQGWKQLSQLVSSHTNILHSSAIAPLLIQEQKKVYDSGLTEYFPWSYHPEGLFNVFLPSNEKIKQIWNAYELSINSAIQQRKFDMIVLPSPLISTPITPYYEYTDTITVCPSVHREWQEYEFSIWKPKVEKESYYQQMISFKLTKHSIKQLRDEGVPEEILEALKPLKWRDFTEDEFLEAVEKHIGVHQTGKYQRQILKHAQQTK